MRGPRNGSSRTDTGQSKPPAPYALATIGAVVAGATVFAVYATCSRILRVFASKGIASPLLVVFAVCLIAGSCFLLVPALRGLLLARTVPQKAAVSIPEARATAARARSLAWIAIGNAAAVGIVLLFARFIVANNLAVGETFFNLTLIQQSFWLVLQAFWVNVEMFMIAEVFILVWALVIVVARLAPGEAGAPLRFLATAYVDIFRALPAIIAIYLIGFGLPLTGLKIFDDVPQMALAILALTLSYGAFVSEVYRSGIESVHPSQTAAARSLGLSYGQTMRWVVLPQAFRRIVPPLLNDFIALQKDTALVNVIGTIDAFNQAKMVASNHFNLSSVTTVALLFVIITIPQSRLVDWMIASDQRRMLAGR